MDQSITLIGIAVVFIGMIILIIGSILGGEGGSKTEWGVGGFIGPIPFGWASSPQMLRIILAITVVMVIIFFLFWLR